MSKKIDSLFALQKQAEPIPIDIEKTVIEIMKRNDEFPMGSRCRVSLKTTRKWVEEKMGYKITKKQVEHIIEKAGRRSWACA